MANKKIKVMILDGISEPVITEITDSLDEYYKIIGCRVIELPERKIGGIRYWIICDEEFLLTESQSPENISSICYRDGKCAEIILGKIIIVKPGRGGKCASLTDEDIERIRENIGVPTKVYNYFSKICICGGQTLKHDY